MREVKISAKNQIVISREIRDVLGVKAGDKLLAIPRGDLVILLRRPKSYAKAIAGIGKGLYDSDHLTQEKAGRGHCQPAV